MIGKIIASRMARKVVLALAAAAGGYFVTQYPEVYQTFCGAGQ